MKKKLMTLLLATSVLCSVTACGTKKQSSNNVDTEGREKPKVSDTVSKIGNGDVSFDYWTSIHPVTAKYYKSLNDHPGAKQWEEKTGVKVNYVNPPVGEEKKNLNLMLNDPKSLPDMFSIAAFDNIYPGGTNAAIEDGIILDITDLVENYAPNFMKMVNEDKDLKKAVYNDDGVMTGFGTIIVNKSRRGSAMYGPMINKAYLDKAGLDVPVTIDDWEEMLTAFKEQGVQYPLMFDIKFIKECFSGAFGAQSRGAYYVKDNKVHLSAIEDNYREFLKTMNRWYKKGLIDPDFATRTLQGDVVPAFTSGKAGAYIGHVTDLKSGPVKAKAQGTKEFEQIAAPYPVLKEGDKLHFKDFQTSRTNVACYITTKAKDPISIVEWVDQLYTLEGRMGTFGEEGVTYTMKDGKAVYTDLITKNPDGLNQTDASRKYIMKELYRTWEEDEQAQLYTEQSQYDAWDMWNKAGKDAILPNTLVMTQEESAEFVKVSSQLDTYREEMQQKFIMGQADLEKDWDKYVENIKNLGSDKAVKCEQQAYDRYLKR